MKRTIFGGNISIRYENAINPSPLAVVYEGHSVNSEIRYVTAIAYLLAESWCCLYKAPTFISHNTKETIS